MNGLNIWTSSLVFDPLDQLPVIMLTLECLSTHHLKLPVVESAHFQSFWALVWMSWVLGLLNLDQSPIRADLRQASRQRDHSSTTGVVRTLMGRVLLDIEMPLRLLFWWSEEACGFVVWRLLRLLLSQPLLGLLLESPLEVRLQVIEHVPVLDAQIIKASRNFLFLLNCRFRFAQLAGVFTLWVKSQSTINVLVPAQADLCHESSARCLVLFVVSRLAISRTLVLWGLGLLFLLANSSYLLL